MREGWGVNVRDHRYHKELEILAKQLFIFLLSYTANDGVEPVFVMGGPADREGVWNEPMIQRFEESVKEIGVTRVTLEQGCLGHPLKAPTTLLQNAGLQYLHNEKDTRAELERQQAGGGVPAELWCPGLRRAILDGIRSTGIGDGRDREESEGSLEMKKLTKVS